MDGDATLGGIVMEGMDNAHRSTETRRQMVSLRTLFKVFQVPHHIDYFSLDVEGAESLVLKDFPFNDYNFSFMTVERPKADLRTLLNQKGYMLVANITNWPETVWMHVSVNLTLDEAQQAIMTARPRWLWKEDK